MSNDETGDDDDVEDAQLYEHAAKRKELLRLVLAAVVKVDRDFLGDFVTLLVELHSEILDTLPNNGGHEVRPAFNALVSDIKERALNGPARDLASRRAIDDVMPLRLAALVKPHFRCVDCLCCHGVDQDVRFRWLGRAWHLVDAGSQNRLFHG